MSSLAPPAVAEGQEKRLADQLREDVRNASEINCDGQMQVIAIEMKDGGFAVWDWVVRETVRRDTTHTWEGNARFTYEVGRWIVDEESGWEDDGD